MIGRTPLRKYLSKPVSTAEMKHFCSYLPVSWKEGGYCNAHFTGPLGAQTGWTLTKGTILSSHVDYYNKILRHFRSHSLSQGRGTEIPPGFSFVFAFVMNMLGMHSPQLLATTTRYAVRIYIYIYIERERERKFQR